MPSSSSSGDHAPPNYSDLQKPLEHFRANTKRLRVHPAELTLLWIICAHLVFLPWAIGAMRPWAQWISFGFSVLSFGMALMPRTYTAEHTASNQFRLIMWPKLARFPIFWLGLGLLGYVLTQALNPAWTFQTDGKGWWMASTPHKDWLPTGVDVPFNRWGPWRMLLIYTAGWLTVCAMWVGFTRRRSVQVFFVTLAVNGLLVAAFGVAQRLFGNGKIYWFYKSVNDSFFSSFVYKNHAGAYLVLALAVTCGLAGWFYMRGLRRLE
ncbi:MAG: O-antigen ligase domain-containing protein, partial [Opitutaceae bacterium]|nr:O-antigen ligase domain-containing protein [Opitutaceae bacterium]